MSKEKREGMAAKEAEITAKIQGILTVGQDGGEPRPDVDAEMEWKEAFQAADTEKEKKKVVQTEGAETAKREVLQTADINSKRIFENPELCAQFLRDYSGLEELKNVQAGQIEKAELRYHVFDSRELNADSVIRVRISNEGEDSLKYIYIIPLIDHKSQVDYNVAMQLLCYIVCIWKSWEKEMEEKKISCNTSDFRYPFIFPIVYYEGKGKWTAPTDLRSRVWGGGELSKYIPDFQYHLVRIHDYSDQELLKKKDEMSFLMFLNKLQRAEDVRNLRDIDADEVNEILKDSSDSIVEIVAGTAKSLLRKLNVPEEEADGYIDMLRKERKVGYLFENFEKADIQAERRNTLREKNRADKAEKMLEENKKALEEKNKALEDNKKALEERNKALEEKNKDLEDKDTRLTELYALLRQNPSLSGAEILEKLETR